MSHLYALPVKLSDKVFQQSGKKKKNLRRQLSVSVSVQKQLELLFSTEVHVSVVPISCTFLDAQSNHRTQYHVHSYLLPSIAELALPKVKCSVCTVFTALPGTC